uniref:Uncharacterized protein n=1 Tax=Eucampia antarctica TaxID=49252 RepID=A0A7S2R6D3_9STRA|mmetsp:Transcript_17661/g.17092  ORF Transcript_17661/g.17092 Transcript_17661/m.17092 type:complete len:203 (+) Transcript_17661:65-673(+)|eukprot:CAMPEP_0197832978 /NCGR_PEP_ID=MMETSP1437-20131217/17202_1 /TAXON_ID=49252 ORGANISM="Eucampia antarctica, Strain CCMP1452" /NCGR_SAMPLE_ID=MMETSP1437 /ASSEMBLY_ACC=CAM_ASM_001096 /LENGTH=202 /DNA_ID=CAMNT_0043436685 /DNA_START=48 /DNA_END=656 /DNA_ORIENTATION=+
MVQISKACYFLYFSSFVVRGTNAFAMNNSAGKARNISSTTKRWMAEKQSLPVMASEDVMSTKAHGTSEKPVMKDLKWNCDYETADRICNFNRHYAESAGYWQTTDYLEQVSKTEPTKYYDSVTGAHLYTAPIGRTMEAYVKESLSHGWPSFRDEEVNWDYVRCLPNGECISTTGTHLGHNLPDGKGNRYCINLVCIAGQPSE